MKDHISKLAFELLTVVILATVITLGSTAVLPGQARVTAPLFCDGPYTDPIVVRDHQGKGINFTMYCAGGRGQRHEVGWLWPSLLLGVVYAAVAGLVRHLVLRRQRSDSA